MPPRPFPFQLSIGTDIVRTSRIQDIITRQTSQLDKHNKPDKPDKPDKHDKHDSFLRFLRRLFTYQEQNIFWNEYRGVKRIFQDERHVELVAQHLAGRWAAKEAVIKAVKPRRILMDEVQILPDAVGRGVYALVLDQPAAMRQPDELTEALAAFRARSDVSLSSTSSNLGDRFCDSPGEMAMMDRPKMQGHEVVPEVAEDGVARSEQRLHIKTLERKLDESGPGQVAKISISHDGDYAIAVCLAASEPAPGDVGGEAAARQ